MPHIYENGIKKTYKENKTHKMENIMLGDKSFSIECNDLERRLSLTKTIKETHNILDEFQQTIHNYFRIVSDVNMLYMKTKLNSYMSAYNLINGYKPKTEESK